MNKKLHDRGTEKQPSGVAYRVDRPVRITMNFCELESKLLFCNARGRPIRFYGSFPASVFAVSYFVDLSPYCPHLLFMPENKTVWRR